MGASRLLSILGIAAIGTATLAHGAGPPLDRLILAMFERADRVPSVMIRHYRWAYMDIPAMQFKTEMDGKRHTRQTVIQPLSMQGVVMVDDGRTMQTYSPDEKSLVIMGSPTSSVMAAKDRLRLVLKNYKLDYEENESVAGRDCYRVTATPFSSALPSRVLLIDVEQRILLRQIVETGSGRSVTTIDTLSASYPKKVDSSVFSISTKGLNISREPEPLTLSTLVNVERALKFKPELPKSLPDGFIYSVLQLIRDGKKSILALRLSDGFVHGTVYLTQSSSDDNEMKERNGSTSISRGGIWYRVSGEIPKVLRARVLKAFTDVNGRTKVPNREPIPDKTAFYGLEAWAMQRDQTLALQVPATKNIFFD